jgi:hypothetical protein
MINFNLCEGCPKFEKQQEIILNQCDSVFDAALETQEFIIDCQKTCDRIGANKDE